MSNAQSLTYNVEGLEPQQVDQIIQGIMKNIADLQKLALSIQTQAKAQYDRAVAASQPPAVIEESDKPH